MKSFFKDILKDKDGAYNLRESCTVLFILILVASWIVQTFFGYQVEEYMFYAFASLVGAGCFSYSIERKSSYDDSRERRSRHAGL
jgi:hypothetical protein